MTVCALILAMNLAVPAAETWSTTSGDDAPGTAISLAVAIAAMPVPATETALEPWMVDRKIGRPGAVTAMYGTLVVLQALDIYSTGRALSGGGTEVNPLLKDAAGNRAAMIAAKAISTATSIYFAERAWKKNRKGAVVLMAVVNAVTAGVVAHNLTNGR
jgi:hypothetical protein